MPKLDEGALRRPDFQEGTPVLLDDGQVWYLRHPTFAPTLKRFAFRPGAGGKPTRLRSQFDAGGDAEFGTLLDALVEADLVERQYCALFDLAAHMLRGNYDLTDDDLSALLARYPDADPRAVDSDAAWEVIRAVAMGERPKPSPVGSGSP